MSRARLARRTRARWEAQASRASHRRTRSNTLRQPGRGQARRAATDRCIAMTFRNPNAAAWPKAQQGRAGLTLVELLVTLSIIAILAGLVLGGMYSAAEAARLERTRATIAKIDSILRGQWDTYRTRRLSLAGRGFQGADRRLIAQQRLLQLWETQRHELPHRYADILSTTPSDGVGLRSAYQSWLTATRSDGLQSAETLYLVVTQALGAESDVKFLPSEIGDTDEDGMLEFLDGWGRPIKWLRWAPGFVPSLGADSDLQLASSATRPDPLDPAGAGHPAKLNLIQPPGMPADYGFQLVPLVVSAGPDGVYGIFPLDNEVNGIEPADSNLTWDDHLRNPYSLYKNKDAGDAPTWLGTPFTVGYLAAEGNGHLDNIHNHELRVR
jgi:prepilin-type N-terminal cleavage/methylation domain-containing protein